MNVHDLTPLEVASAVAACGVVMIVIALLVGWSWFALDSWRWKKTCRLSRLDGPYGK